MRNRLICLRAMFIVTIVCNSILAEPAEDTGVLGNQIEGRIG